MPVFDSTTTQLIFWAAIGYLMGSVPYGMIVARVMGLGNLRQIGSGNIGATNVLRTGSKAAAALTLLFDAGKGAVAVLLARALAGDDAAQVAALAAFVGHCYPVWLSFKGGKGVATFLGLWLALDWRVGVACCLTWLVAAAIWRISSLGALAAAALSTTWVMILTDGSTFLLGVVLTLLIYWRHRENLARIKAGTEPKIGKS
ncbi:glycerol-3-phosphate 1-O-acyltransferase PlsY [Ruegeria arenilitoris]|uniref:glycerol-3-phosphate 1-O-acyltransferase PlsY n=1 Tax=Ruegeria arenilitoris TaxID=1173585 RepID=UPI001C9880CC|nr:glycerol-3-phosphate 1-O-acyltransferase PlsY [Ruegeria arenilitoris]MBY6083569.1 glycerol-3-phosphate 1-O-acyltransferase PlsY [Ruegeria arenilitoris]